MNTDSYTFFDTYTIAAGSAVCVTDLQARESLANRKERINLTCAKGVPCLTDLTSFPTDVKQGPNGKLARPTTTTAAAAGRQSSKRKICFCFTSAISSILSSSSSVDNHTMCLGKYWQNGGKHLTMFWTYPKEVSSSSRLQPSTSVRVNVQEYIRYTCSRCTCSGIHFTCIERTWYETNYETRRRVLWFYCRFAAGQCKTLQSLENCVIHPLLIV